MPLFSKAEFYFVAIMMFLILVICVVATYVFIRQFKREKKAREEAKNKKIQNPKSEIQN